jgi:hypothetical protein
MRAGLLRTSRAAAIALATLAGCGSPAAPDSPTTAPAAAAAESAEDLPELTAVPAPENLVGVATLRTPARTLDTAMAWTGLGIDFRTLAQSGPGAAILPVLDLEAPIDLVATLDPKSKNRPRVLFAASVGLTSRQAALDAFASLDYPVEFVEPGIHSVRPSAKTLCFVAPALGRAKSRLVCGQDRESVELLSPYLTRGMPSEGTGDADLHVDLRAEAPWRTFGEKTQFLQLGVPMLLGEVSIGNPEFDGALRDAATALVDELILSLGELRDLRLDAWLRADANAPQNNELDVQFQVAFNSARSFASRALADGEGRASAAPDSFWKLPGDATQAAYYSVSNPALSQSAVDLLERLFESGLGHLGASPAVQRAWPAAFKQAMDVKGPIVSARGNIPKTSLPATLDARETLRSALGYTVLGVDDPDKRYAAWFEKTLALYEDAALRKSLSQKYGLDPSKLPKATSKKGPARLKEARLYELSIPAALLADVLDDESVDATKLAPVPLVIVACREGQSSWFGVSSYASVLEEKLVAVVSGNGTEGTLKARAGLERLGVERGNVAGFQTLGGLASSPSLAKGDLGPMLAPLAESDIPLIARAQAFGPGHGNVPGPGPNGLVQLHVPAQVFKEVAFAALRRVK